MTDHEVPHSDLAGFVLGALAPSEEATFRAHLERCEVCRRGVNELSSLPALLSRTAPRVEPPAALRGRTLRAVVREAAIRVPGTASDARVTARRFLRPRVVSMIAAAAVIAVIAGALAARLTSSPSFDTRIVLAAAEVGSSARGIALVRETDDGREVELDVAGLPPNDDESFYECWFVGDGDTLEEPNRVSVGTFKVGPDGRAKVRMFSAADAERFPKMGVTREPDDGNPQRTGPKALVSRN